MEKIHKGKIAASIIALIMAFLLAACTISSPQGTPLSPAPDTSAAPSSGTSAGASAGASAGVTDGGGTDEKLGFSGTNIEQGGLICPGDDGLVYYRSEADHWALYRAKPDGSIKTKLADDVPCGINVLDGYVYYCNYLEEFSLCRIKTDGTGRQVLKDGLCGDVYVAGDMIYYDIRDEANAAQVRSMNKDGSGDALLVSNAYLAGCGDGVLYIRRIQHEEAVHALSLWAYDLETKSVTRLTNEYTAYVALAAGGIYYLNGDTSEVCRINDDGTGREVVVSGVTYYNIAAGVLYYQKSGDMNIYRLSLTDKKTTPVTDVVLQPYVDFEGNIITDTAGLDDDSEYFSESISFVYISGDSVFCRASLREALLQNGRADCLIRCGGTSGITVWD